MNEEELKKEIEKWSRGCNVNIDFPKGLKYCDGINLCKVCKTNLDLYEAELKGFQKGKLEQKKEELKRIIELQKKIRRYLIDNSRCDCLELTTKYGDISDVLFWEYEKQLQKEIEEEKQDENS